MKRSNTAETVDQTIEDYKARIEALSVIIDTYDLWMYEKIEGNSIYEYLSREKIKRVVIYGMGRIGYRLFQELSKTEIKAVFVIDRNINKIGDFNIISPEEKIPDADIMIVTPERDYAEIANSMKNKVDYPIISFIQLMTMSFKCRF